MEDLITAFVYDPRMLGDDLASIAEARMPQALREDVRRSHEATFNFAAGTGPVLFDEDYLASIQHEVLLIHGRDDTVIPRGASYYFVDHLPNATMHIVANCGHWTQIEHPAIFRALTRAFLAST